MREAAIEELSYGTLDDFVDFSPGWRLAKSDETLQSDSS
jgi:hypothetical protein